MTQPPMYQQPLYQQQPAPQSPLQPPLASPPKKKGPPKKVLIIAAVAIVGVIGLGLVGVVAALFMSGGGDDPLLDETVEMSLPNHLEGLGSVVIYAHDNYQNVPPAILSSALAPVVCGGTDLASTFLAAKRGDLSTVASLGLFNVLSQANIRSGLQCASDLQATLEEPRAARVTWKDGDQRNQVILMQATAAQVAMPRHNFSGLDGHCVTGDDGHCTPGGTAALHLDEHHWAFGSFEGVSVFARASQSSNHEPGTKEIILRELADGLDAFDFSTLEARPEHVQWSKVCADAAVGDNDATFMAACFPSGQERVIESIETKLRGVATQWDTIGTHNAIHYRITLLARDDAAAESIESDLTDLHRDWASQLSNEESTMVRELAHVPDESPDVTWRAAIPALTRAVRDAEIERDGERVILDIHGELNEGEITEMADMRRSSTEVNAALARVLDAIREGQAPARADLEQFVSSSVAGWMLAPRASQADCQAVQDHLAELIQGGVAPELFGIKFAVDQHYGAEHCVGRVLAEGTVQCLTSAADLPAMAACPLPPSPFALEMIGTLGGQWQASNVRGYGNYRLRRALSNARLEIADGQLALEVDGVQSIPLQVEASASTQGTVTLPVNGIQRAQITVVGDTLVVTGLPGDLGVTFERANFEPSLFTLLPVAQ